MLPYGKARLKTLMFRGSQFYFGFQKHVLLYWASTPEQIVEEGDQYNKI